MSTFSVGQMNQLGDALEVAGFTPADVTKLGQCGKLASVRAFLEGHAEIVIKKVEETIVSILALVKTITTPAVVGKKTKDCFTNKSRYAYRDSDLDNWLPQNQPGQSEGKFSVQNLTRGATFKQVVESFVGAAGEISDLTPILRHHITTLPTIESLIERQEAGEDVGLRMDGWGNFFFVEDAEGGLSVVLVNRLGYGRWHVNVRRLDRGVVWHGGRRFFFRNTDTVSL
jgi:hypothetical protein